MPIDPSRPRPAVDANSGELDDLLNETRTLQRRVNFWQRTAWLLLGGVVIVGTIIWQRGELRRRECYQSLDYYAGLARRAQLGRQHPEILEQQWQSFDKGMVKLTAIHYDLIVQNWLATPKPGERLPLAVCRESHFLTLSLGRYVLFHGEDGDRIEWRSEEKAQELVGEAAKDNHGR